VVTASVLCAPYGFVYDQSLLMIPITFLAANTARQAGKIPFRLVVIYTAVNLAVLGIVLVSFFWAFIPAPIVVAMMLWRRRGGDREIESATGFLADHSELVD